MSWIGGILLEAQSISDQGVTESGFLGEWKNQMPEAWRKHVALSALKVLRSHSFLSSHNILTILFSSANIPIHQKEQSSSATVQMIPRVVRWF